MHDLIYFLGQNILDDDGFHNVFVYQPTLNKLELKEDKGTDYAVGCKSKRVYFSKLTYYLYNFYNLYIIPLYTAFCIALNILDIE